MRLVRKHAVDIDLLNIVLCTCGFYCAVCEMLRPECPCLEQRLQGRLWQQTSIIPGSSIKHTNHYRLLSEQTPVKYNVVPNFTIILCPMMSRSYLSEAMAGLHMMDAEQR